MTATESLTGAEQVPIAPGRLPGLGHALSMLRDPLGFLTSLGGTGGVVRVEVGTRPIHVVAAPDLVHELLTQQAGACPRGGVHDTIKDHFGVGLLAIDGEEHRIHRRALQPCFRSDRIAGYVPVMSRVAQDRVDRWQPGQILSLGEELHALSLQIVTATLFGTKLAEESATAFLTAFPHMVKGLIVQGLYPNSALGRLPLPVNRRFAAAVRVLNNTADEIIRTAENNPKGIVAVLRESFDESVVRAEVITMLVAATETAAATLGWLFHELDQHPDIKCAVLAELDTQLGEDVELTAEHLERLSHTQRVVREVLRRHAPNAFLMRKTTAPTRLGRYALPAGAELLFCLTALHRSPELYVDPLRFDPDRWLPDRATAVPRSAYLPFATGRHKCIGDDFAWAELMAVAIAVLRRWHLTPQPGTHVKEAVWMTVQASGLTMRVTSR
jgi:cytochrome P450